MTFVHSETHLILRSASLSSSQVIWMSLQETRLFQGDKFVSLIHSIDFFSVGMLLNKIFSGLFYVISLFVILIYF